MLSVAQIVTDVNSSQCILVHPNKSFLCSVGSFMPFSNTAVSLIAPLVLLGSTVPHWDIRCKCMSCEYTLVFSCTWPWIHLSSTCTAICRPISTPQLAPGFRAFWQIIPFLKLSKLLSHDKYGLCVWV